MPEFNFERGEVLLLDKPLGWTSFDVVAKVRNLTGVRKVGHAGTLDPLATGLLIVCTGAKTKTIATIQDADKEYLAQFRLGATTATYDAETEPTNIVDVSTLREEKILAAMSQFVGIISQVPPPFSAVKVGGKRAYALARAGKEVVLEPRQIRIDIFELLEYDPTLGQGLARIACQKGTYVRSLVHDLGLALGVGGYLTGLVRTRIGTYKLADAYSLAQLVTQIAGAKSVPK